MWGQVRQWNGNTIPGVKNFTWGCANNWHLDLLAEPGKKNKGRSAAVTKPIHLLVSSNEVKNFLLLEVFHILENIWLNTESRVWHGWLGHSPQMWANPAAISTDGALNYLKHNGTTLDKQILLSLDLLVRMKTITTSGFCKAVTKMVFMFGEWRLCGRWKSFLLWNSLFAEKSMSSTFHVCSSK